MRKIAENKKQDPQVIHSSLQKGFGIEHPERIHGYAGFFFGLGDVYASDWVADRMERSERFREFVFQSLERFKHDDYGDISESNCDENIENKWLFGGWPLFGRYSYIVKRGNGKEIVETVIKVRCLKNATTVMDESEIDEIP